MMGKKAESIKEGQRPWAGCKRSPAVPDRDLVVDPGRTVLGLRDT
jgi:hypothetical protein